jgi:hypothetical protein
MFAPMIGSVVMSEIDAVMYVILSEVEEHMPYGQVVGTRECSDAIYEVSHKPRVL